MSEECITMADIDTANMHTYLKKSIFKSEYKSCASCLSRFSEDFYAGWWFDKIRMEHHINCCMLELAWWKGKTNSSCLFYYNLPIAQS